jgi:glutamate 5-kinase
MMQQDADSPGEGAIFMPANVCQLPNRRITEMEAVISHGLVLKVGTSTIVERRGDGRDQLDFASFQRIGPQIDEVVDSGRGVILVSPSARQRLPGVGWDGVYRVWDESIAAPTESFQLTDAQLNTPVGCREVFAVAAMGGVAVVNAHDDVLIPRSPYRNNDIVGATLTAHAGHHAFGKGDTELGMLSDVSGVLADIRDPHSVIPVIDDLDAYQHLAKGTETEGAIGGMDTKFMAVRIVRVCGRKAWIAHGRAEDVVQQALSGLTGSHFPVREQTRRFSMIQ